MKILKTTLRSSLAVMLMGTSLNVLAMGQDDPLLTYVKADKLERRDSDEGNIAVWELDAWIGRDLNKFWLKHSGESVDGSVESSEIDLLYSQAVTPYWDLQYGIRHTIEPKRETWVGAGFNGLAPYLFEIDTNAFINDDGNINARIDIEYEYMITQKFVVVPNLELSAYTKDDEANGIESGLSSMELGVRFLYEMRREFSPYIGINYEKTFGDDTESETQLLGGVSFWF